jgi:hypothetical protein
VEGDEVGRCGVAGAADLVDNGRTATLADPAGLAALRHPLVRGLRDRKASSVVTSVCRVIRTLFSQAPSWPSSSPCSAGEGGDRCPRRLREVPA